jgi:hypothetical protein
MFRPRSIHHQGAVLFFAKTTDIVFYLLFDMDSVNAMAAHRPVVQACERRTQKQQSVSLVMFCVYVIIFQQ